MFNVIYEKWLMTLNSPILSQGQFIPNVLTFFQLSLSFPGD